MVLDRYARFADSADVLSCPLCHSALKLQEGSLVCPKRHCFDIAKQGYVNLLGPSRQSAHYSKESFESRMAILEAGYYDHVKEAVLTAVGRALSPSEGPAAVNATPFRVLDAGCGEGFYARAIRENLCVDVVAFDLSKDAMLMAAPPRFQKGGQMAGWRPDEHPRAERLHQLRGGRIRSLELRRIQARSHPNQKRLRARSAGQSGSRQQSSYGAAPPC